MLKHNGWLCERHVLRDEINENTKITVIVNNYTLFSDKSYGSFKTAAM